MAFSAFIESAVRFVTEGDIAGILDLKGEFFRRMAGSTDRKGRGVLSIVTGAAGLAIFHFSHADLLSPAGCRVKTGVAVAAVVAFDVFGMFEVGRSGFLDLEDYVFGWMTGGTAFDIKSRFSIVTGAAGFPLLHIGHGCALVGAGHKLCRVARAAVRADFQVFLVAEMRCSGCSDRIDDLFDLVAVDALLKREGVFTIVTGAAGFSFFHSSHSDSVALSLGGEQAGMTVAAVVAFDVFGMFEEGRPGFLDLEGDLLDRVTGGAFVDPKGFFAIMAGAT